MKHPPEELKITMRELENLTGLEVNEIFIGSILGGVYRPSIFKSFERLVYFCLTEVSVSILVFIFSLPFGFLVIRNYTNAITDSSTIFKFLQIVLGITLGAIVGWNVYMLSKVKRLKTLTHLLDEVDKYNEVIQAVEMIDKLEAIGSLKTNVIDRCQVNEALNLARNSLVCGLMTDRVLRDNRNLLTRRSELVTNIENNLAALKSLEINNQANEYAVILDRAFQIGMSIYQEVQRYS